MAFSDKIIETVWQSARVMDDHDPNTWRKDQCGAWMRRDQYHKEDSEFGWKILNVSPGGSDKPDNLQAFHKDNSFDIENGRARCEIKANRSEHGPDHSLDKPDNRQL